MFSFYWGRALGGYGLGGEQDPDLRWVALHGGVALLPGRPLKTTALGYKRGRSAASARGQDNDSSVNTIKKKHIKGIMDSVIVECELKITELKALIKQVEEQGTPRGYVINRNTAKVRRALTYFEETGTGALAWCGFKFGRAQVRLAKEVGPTTRWRSICATCLPEVRATRRAQAGE